MKEKSRPVHGLSIFHRLLFGFIGVSLFIISVMGTVYYFYARQRVSEFQRNEIEYSLQNALAYFKNTYSNSITTDLTLLETAPSLDNFLSARQEEVPLVRFDIEKMFFRLAKTHKDLYRAIIFFDAYGHEKIAIQDEKRVRKYSSISHYKANDAPIPAGMAKLFDRLKSAPPGNIYFEGPFRDPENKLIVAVGISKREPEIAGFGGVIMVLCDFSPFINYLANIKVFNAPVAWVYGGGGEVLLSPPYSDELQDPRLYKEELQDGEFRVHAHDQYIHIQCRGCRLGTDEHSIWHISFTLPPDIHATLMNDVVSRGILATTFILVVAVLISFFLANQFTKPIIELSRASRQISKGKTPDAPPDGASGELGELSRDFYRMATKLQEAIAKRDAEIFQRKTAEASLQKAHDELEKRVEERTVDLRTAHEQLLHTEKLSAIGQLAASIAHEFNNPLAGIINVINGIKRRASYTEADGRLIDMALDECKRIKMLIRSLQDFNRPSSGALAPVDIHAAIDSLLILGKNEFEKNNIVIQKHYAKEVPLLRAVSDQIKQVLLNLFNNAVHACANGGTLSISTRVSNNNLCIEVRDSGQGIAPENINRIFEPFFTTKPEVKGTGLGLSVSYGIIKSHGGTIHVDSVLNEGTTFIIRLPLEGGGDDPKNNSAG